MKNSRFPHFDILLLFGWLFTLVFVSACKDDDVVVETSPAPPIISSFTPESGEAGTEVTITGENFSTATAGNIVKFSGEEAEVLTASATMLTVTVPATAGTGKVSVTANGQTATSEKDFVVLEAPRITGFSPESGNVGTEVTITGENFSIIPSENTIAFSSVPAEVLEATATQLKVIVPEEAATGKITITVGDKTATSEKEFLVIPHWEAMQAGGLEHERSQSVAVDHLGNTFVTGSFQGSSTFGDISLTADGALDIFIAKYNKEGEIQWATKAGGTNNDLSASIAVDSEGNAYITGRFSSNTIHFGSHSLTTKGDYDGFIAKCDASGSFVWVNQIGGAGAEGGASVIVNKENEILVTGSFSATLDFGTTSLTKTGDDKDIFLAKYSDSGNLLWAQKEGGVDNQRSASMAVDKDGNLFVTGSFDGSATFGEDIHEASGSMDIFVVKYNASGAYLWSAKAGGAHSSGNISDKGLSIAVDGSGNAFITGEFFETAFFGSISLTNSSTGGDAYLAKFSPSGVPLWAKSIGGPDFNIGYAVAVNTSGEVYVMGQFQGTVSLGDTELTSPGDNTSTFVAKYSTSGELNWAKMAGGTGEDYFGVLGTAMAIDAFGYVVATGSFYGTTTFENTTLSTELNHDVFLWRTAP